jgi:hypothetical protein
MSTPTGRKSLGVRFKTWWTPPLGLLIFPGSLFADFAKNLIQVHPVLCKVQGYLSLIDTDCLRMLFGGDHFSNMLDFFVVRLPVRLDHFSGW